MSKHHNVIPNDGYTEPGYVAARPGLHDELRFTFRPMLPAEQGKWVRDSDKMRPELFDRECAKMIASRVKSWSLVDGKDEPLPISPKTIGQLKPAVFNRLHGIVLGTDASDIDPKWDEDKEAEELEQQREAGESGMNVGELRQEANEKN
jgi:hypothetical protein